MKTWERYLTTPLDDDSRREVARLVRAQRADAPPEARAGTVIEYRLGGQLSCGFLMFTPTGRRSCTVVGVDGRQRHVRRDKVVDLSKQYVRIYPPDHSLDELQRIDAERRSASEQVDVDTLWRVIVDGDTDRSWRLDELAELHDREATDPTRRAGLLRALWRGERFEREGSRWRPKSKTAVADMEAAAARREAEALHRAELAAWVRRVADGGDPEPRPDGADDAVDLLESAALGEESTASAELMQAAHLHGAGAAFDALVRLGRWSPHENLELHRLGIPTDFGAATLAAAEATDVAAAQAAWPGRRRWGGSIYTSPGGERAYRVRRALRSRAVVDIHLAVPALLVTPGGALDAEASERGVAVGLLEGAVPLLPEPIQRASALTPTAPRPALTLTVRLDEGLALTHVQLTTSRVRPRAVLDSEAAAASMPAAVRRLAQLATALRQRRRQAGAWEGLQATPWIELHDGMPRRARESPAQRIDTELELLARQALAQLFLREELPAVFATREAPTAALLPAGTETVGDDTAAPGAPEAPVGVSPVPQVRIPAGDTDAENAVRSFLLEGRSARASLATTPGVHAGLGLRACAAGTRPLTDAVDLALQRQLLARVGVRGVFLDAATLEQVLLDTQAAREAADRVERRSRRDWSLVWLQGFGADERVEGIVVEPRGAGHLVLLAGGPVSAWVPAAAGQRLEAAPGQRLRLRVEQASTRADVLRLADPQPA